MAAHIQHAQVSQIDLITRAEDVSFLSDRTARTMAPAVGSRAEIHQLLAGRVAADTFMPIIAMLKACDSSAAVRVSALLSSFAAVFGTAPLTYAGLTLTPAVTADAGVNRAAVGQGPVLVDAKDIRPFVGAMDENNTREPPTDAVAAAYMTLAICAVIKSPTAQNMSAFTVNRPRALKGRLGLGDRYFVVGGRDALAAQDFTHIHNAFTANPIAKRALISACFHVTRAPIGIYAETLASQFELLAEYGLTGYKMAVKAIINDPVIADTFPAVKAEIVLLRRMAEQRAAESSLLRLYGKAMFGDLYTTVRMKEIPLLAAIGLAIEKAQSSTAANIVGPTISQATQQKIDAYVIRKDY